MVVYAGRWGHVDGYAKNDSFAVVIPSSSIEPSRTIIAIYQWTKDASGTDKPVTTLKTTIRSVETNSDGTKSIVFGVPKEHYYWFRGKVDADGTNLSLTMLNPSEQVVGDPKLPLIYSP
ncbi:hypothetical protein GGS21DRAFT_489271 [Xylaria nigripes]|nr:hypothetical protein GGS21DRAFT_489271 [Xylaria nigripes]